MPASTLDIPPWIPPQQTKAEDIEWAPLHTLDLSQITGDDFTEVSDSIVEEVGKVFTETGFIYANNHGLSHEQVLRQFAIGQYAFNNVSAEDKEKYKADIIKTGSFRGYKQAGHWRIDGVKDSIEQLNFTSQSYSPQVRQELYPPSLQALMPEIEAFAKFNHENILRKILTVLSRVLKLPPNALWELSKNPEEKGLDLLRYAMYHTPPSEDDKALGGVRLQGHTDFNSCSILWSQPITSLEVLMPEGVWKLVKHKDNHLVINLGDAMHFLSGTYLKQTIHRVVSPPLDQAHYTRLGLFYFALFNKDVQLNPLIESPVVREALNGRDIWAETKAKGHQVPTAGQWEEERVRRFGQAQAQKREDGHEEDEIVPGQKMTLYNTNEKNKRRQAAAQAQAGEQAAQ